MIDSPVFLQTMSVYSMFSTILSLCMCLCSCVYHCSFFKISRLNRKLCAIARFVFVSRAKDYNDKNDKNKRYKTKRTRQNGHSRQDKRDKMGQDKKDKRDKQDKEKKIRQKGRPFFIDFLSPKSRLSLYF